METLSVGDFGLRDRLDFVFEDNRHGLYSHAEKKIIDIEICGQLSAPLQDFYSEFKKMKWPIQKGSFRLRTGPQNQKGVWLDFANLDIKKLLAEKSILENLNKIATVEIGRHQKIYKDGKLTEPEFKPWFATANKKQSNPLLCSVSSFTQPSMKSNLKIIETLLNYYSKNLFQNALEWGAGIGNLSIPICDLTENLDILEFNKKDIQCLHENLKIWGYDKKVQIEQGDFQKNKKDLKNYDFLVFNPARSGLGNFLDDLQKSHQKIFMMSCFLDSWIQDAHQLQQAGFQIDHIAILDQFPQTHHFEILSFFS